MLCFPKYKYVMFHIYIYNIYIYICTYYIIICMVVVQVSRMKVKSSLKTNCVYFTHTNCCLAGFEGLVRYLLGRTCLSYWYTQTDMVLVKPKRYIEIWPSSAEKIFNTNISKHHYSPLNIIKSVGITICTTMVFINP